MNKIIKIINNVIDKIARFPRNWIVFAEDIFIIIISALGSFALRLDLGPLFILYLPQAITLVVVSLLVKPIVYYFFGFYRRLWAYASIQELKLITVGVTTASVLVSIIIVFLRAVELIPYFPRSTLPIDWLLSLVLVGGSRFSMRILAESRGETKPNGKRGRRVLVVGAGDAGALVVREMQKNQQLGLEPIGFLDDDQSKQKQQIHGIPVMGSLEDLARLVSTMRINEVVIAIPSAPGAVVRQIADICRQKNIPFRTMPGIYELIGGTVNVSR
ncbi:MAG: hypothetical protein KAT29_01470, partial [Anaerolineales bacterium]|nr:hypothetical protein [Anaerolineales bacterium]